jgi:hypothetical protein
MQRPIGILFVAAVLSGCQSAGTPTAGPTTGPATPAATATVAPPTGNPTATVVAKPVALPREVPVPIDGRCESEDQGCLGLLKAGTVYTTTTFKPKLSFSVPTAEWDNPNEAGGEMPLFSTRPELLGDVIFFFSHAQSIDPKVGSKFEEIVAWLQTYDQIDATPAKPVTIGGLKGVTMDVKVAPGAVNADPACPAQVCVGILVGADPDPKDPYLWHWDWGLGGTEIMRLNLLNANGNTVLVLADSVDGTTFKAITDALDAIAPTIKFDLSAG